MGKLVVLNGTDDEWKLAVYPHIAGKNSKKAKEIKVRRLLLRNIIAIFSTQGKYTIIIINLLYNYRLKARHAPFQSLAS